MRSRNKKEPSFVTSHFSIEKAILDKTRLALLPFIGSALCACLWVDCASLEGLQGSFRMSSIRMQVCVFEGGSRRWETTGLLSVVCVLFLFKSCF